MKNLVLLDVDGTLVNQQTQRLLLGILRANGIVGRFDFLLLSLWFIAYQLRIVRNTDKVRRMAYRNLAGVKALELDSILETNFESFRSNILPQAYEIVQKHKRAGDELLVVSASVEPIISRICMHFAISDYICTQLEVCDGILTGNILGHAMYGEQKLAEIADHINNSAEVYHQTICYADHISDLPMLEMVDIPICVNPDAKLSVIARDRKWEILTWS